MKTSAIEALWMLEEGVEFVRQLQDGASERGFILFLGVSVPNIGKSLYDLDVMAAPAKDAKPDVNAFIVWLAHQLVIGRLRPWNAAMLLVNFTDQYGRKINFFIVDVAASAQHWLQAEADRKVAEGH